VDKSNCCTLGSHVRSGRSTQGKRAGLTLVELLVILAIIVLLVCLMLPAVRTAREPARRNQCMSQMRQMGLALLNHAETRGGLSPAYTTDSDGKPLHSWRTQLLPNLEGRNLYESIDLAKSWDDPANAEAKTTNVDGYQCPSKRELNNRTTYLAIVTPNSCFRATEPGSLSDIIDGAARTMMVIEVFEDHAVPWMSPFDADEKGFMEYRGSRHDRVFGALFADGHVEMMRDDISADVLRKLISIAGNDNPREE
jgi:prepilin-type processing-associated H-X9-DG protein